MDEIKIKEKVCSLLEEYEEFVDSTGFNGCLSIEEYLSLRKYALWEMNNYDARNRKRQCNNSVKTPVALISKITTPVPASEFDSEKLSQKRVMSQEPTKSELPKEEAQGITELDLFNMLKDE